MESACGGAGGAVCGEDGEGLAHLLGGNEVRGGGGEMGVSDGRHWGEDRRYGD